MNTTVRCGVAGVGYLGQHHARIYHELPEAELAGVYDVDEARARQIAGQYSCQQFSSLAELGAACEAVSVVVPTDRHCDAALGLLEHGCHLLIEKPLCTSLDEAERILEGARAAGAIVQVGHIEHFNPVMGFLEKEVIDPRYIVAERLAPFQPRGTEVGIVLDLMIHDIGIILQLVRSPVVKIDSVGVQVVSKSEDIANARLAFANGCVANLNVSRMSFKKVREIRVFQPTGYLSFDFMNQTGHLVHTPNLLGYAAALAAGKVAPGDLSSLPVEQIPLEKGEPLRIELASFLESVRLAREPKVGAALGRSALEVAITITEQIRGSVQAP